MIIYLELLKINKMKKQKCEKIALPQRLTFDYFKLAFHFRYFFFMLPHEYKQTNLLKKI